MTHDVTKDPLDPAMRAWVDKAAEEVVDFMNGRRKLEVGGAYYETLRKDAQKAGSEYSPRRRDDEAD